MTEQRSSVQVRHEEEKKAAKVTVRRSTSKRSQLGRDDGAEAVPVLRLLPPLLRRRQQCGGARHGLRTHARRVGAAPRLGGAGLLALLETARDGVADNVNVVVMVCTLLMLLAGKIAWTQRADGVYLGDEFIW